MNTIVDDGRGQEEYVRQILEAYRKTPGTMGTRCTGGLAVLTVHSPAERAGLRSGFVGATQQLQRSHASPFSNFSVGDLTEIPGWAPGERRLHLPVGRQDLPDRA